MCALQITRSQQSAINVSTDLNSQRARFRSARSFSERAAFALPPPQKHSKIQVRAVSVHFQVIVL
jgi:hypothetical protein